jgi:hypothetical protein
MRACPGQGLNTILKGEDVNLKIVILGIGFLLPTQTLAQDAGQYVSAAIKGTEALRDRMRDPDSLRIDKVFYRMKKNGNDYEVCYEYGATNGFGGMNRGIAYLNAKGTISSDRDRNECYMKPGWSNVKRLKDAVEITKEYKAAMTEVKN